MFIVIGSCRHPDEKRSVQEKSASDSPTKTAIEEDTSEYTEWIKYEIDNFGEIMIPPEMEMQKGKYKELNDKLRSVAGLVGKQIVFQQAGLNDFDEVAANSYSRIMVKTLKSDLDFKGDLRNYPLNTEELSEMQDDFKSEFLSPMKSQGMQITEWFPVEIVRVNGMEAMLISYKRKIGKNPEAFVRMYQFLNGDMQHFVTLSYRVTEMDKWKHLLDKALSSLKINELD
jgi:hypothetical protein